MSFPGKGKRVLTPGDSVLIGQGDVSSALPAAARLHAARAHRAAALRPDGSHPRGNFSPDIIDSFPQDRVQILSKGY